MHPFKNRSWACGAGVEDWWSVLLLVALGIGVIVYSIYRPIEEHNLQQHGIRTVVTVEHTKIEHSGKSTDTYYDLHFKLRTGQSTNEWTDEVTRDAHIGDKIKVHYLPGKPSTVQDVGQEGDWWVSLIIGPLGLVALASAAAMAWPKDKSLDWLTPRERERVVAAMERERATRKGARKRRRQRPAARRPRTRLGGRDESDERIMLRVPRFTQFYMPPILALAFLVCWQQNGPLFAVILFGAAAVLVVVGLLGRVVLLRRDGLSYGWFFFPFKSVAWEDITSIEEDSHRNYRYVRLTVDDDRMVKLPCPMENWTSYLGKAGVGFEADMDRIRDRWLGATGRVQRNRR
jgi:hypothetical protein